MTGAAQDAGSTGQAHVPVMLAEVLEALAPRDGGIYIDATFGRGSYSRGLLGTAETRVFGIDRDPEAASEGHLLEQESEGRFAFRQGRFSEMERLVPDHGGTVDGITFDFGLSSPQIDQPERGFSFRQDGPLDMRMELSGPSAADAVNGLPEKELADILWRYGEERRSRAVAAAIVKARREQPIETTGALADIIRSVVKPARDGIDPATRSFQGLRIYVNDELGEIERGLAAAERMLAPRGRLAVVSFHSLEDRAVKRFLQARSGRAPKASRHQPPAQAEQLPSFALITRSARRPSERECQANPRARSARLRAAERSEAAAWPGDIS